MNKKFQNQVQLVGHLGKDVQIVQCKNGNKKAMCTLATNEFYRDTQGQFVKQTMWHNIIAWGTLADEIHGALTKGGHVSFIGKKTYRAYTDKMGNNRMHTEIVVSKFAIENQVSTPTEERAMVVPF